MTPDSFSDGGEFNQLNKGIEQAKLMFDEGSNFIDIGGESTRPGAKKVKVFEEIMRVLPIIQKLTKMKIPVSLDSRNAATMTFAKYCDISVFNDVSGLTYDKRSIDVIKRTKLPVILMHMPATPKNMMKKNIYSNVLLDVYDFLERRINLCIKNGINKDRIIIDPGIGFGKDSFQNITLLKNISLFHSLGCPIMLGVSRKSFISKLGKNENPKNRVSGSISISLNCLKQGVEIYRVHDVKETIQAFEMWLKLEN